MMMTDSALCMNLIQLFLVLTIVLHYCLSSNRFIFATNTLQQIQVQVLVQVLVQRFALLCQHVDLAFYLCLSGNRAVYSPYQVQVLPYNLQVLLVQIQVHVQVLWYSRCARKQVQILHNCKQKISHLRFFSTTLPTLPRGFYFWEEGATPLYKNISDVILYLLHSLIFTGSPTCRKSSYTVLELG
jgi:hypothetical protein